MKRRIASIVAGVAISLAVVTGSASVPAHSSLFNRNVNQMLLTMKDCSLRFYDTAALSALAFDSATGEMVVTPKDGEWTDTYGADLAAVDFAKPCAEVAGGEIVNRGVEITEARPWLESLYAEWKPMSGASSYRVYIKGGAYASNTLVDRELVRDYGTYGRVDVPGLPAATYSLRVVPVVEGVEREELSSTVERLEVRPHDRSGFAFLGHEGGIGAYKDNGELKDDARVIYVTSATAKTVTCNVRQSVKDDVGKEFTGLQAIITAYQKGVETRPLAVRILGTIEAGDMDSFGSKAEGLQVKGRNAYSPLNITIEGIGEDAAIRGFGILVRNSTSVEFRNFAVMLCMDDCLSFDTANSHCWVHNMDFFYGSAGSDKDQAKGDGTVDLKGHSRYITVAYNRFWDCGKTSLAGMKSESTEDYADYHHNWFDHSDSRHPRVRTMSVHVWNNYYDGVSKYGVGATMGSSIFVESNFYRATPDPMLISGQGTDAKGSGTFSGESGGMIKSYGNVYAEKGSSSNYTVITQEQSSVSFDCYQVSERGERVPDTVKTLVGGNVYNNFDTDPALMFSYTPLRAIDVPAVVTGSFGAGRLNHGSFTYDLTYPGSDRDYSVVAGLKEALSTHIPAPFTIYP